MPAFDLERVKQQGRRLLDEFTTGQKVMVALAVVVVLAGGYLFTQWAAKPSYATLFTSLDANDASQITDQLTSKNVPYRLEDGGKTITVPQDQVYQLRLDLSAQGLPSSGGPGYSLLDQEGVTTSEFRQRVDYQRALQGELAKTITAMDDIESASVHLVVPQQDVFAADEQKASASVLVKAKPGARLRSGQVQAVVNLVASSVSGMKTEDVTVADTTGHVLSSPDVMDGIAGDLHGEQTAAFETTLGTSVQDMLDQVIGSGRSVVRVNADMDFDQRATTSETFKNGLAEQAQAQAAATGQAPPVGGAQALTEQRSTETYTGGSAAASGVLGPTGTAGGTGGSTSYQKDESTRTYALDKVTEEVRAAPGSVKRLSVALLFDSRDISRMQADSLAGAVSAAVGLDAQRGDTIQTSLVAFDQHAKRAAAGAATATSSDPGGTDLVALGRNGLAVLMVGVILFLAWRATKRASARQAIERMPIDLHTLDPQLVAAGASPLPGAPARAELATAPGAGAAPVRPVMAGLGDEIEDLIDRQPDEVTATLRGWLADRRQ
jgi:flagellar M-ring protein FliF